MSINWNVNRLGLPYCNTDAKRARHNHKPEKNVEASDREHRTRFRDQGQEENVRLHCVYIPLRHQHLRRQRLDDDQRDANQGRPRLTFLGLDNCSPTLSRSWRCTLSRVNDGRDRTSCRARDELSGHPPPRVIRSRPSQQVPAPRRRRRGSSSRHEAG